MINKGIILAGGYGTRMSPLTKAINKQLLPIYDKPLIFYPLSILMLSGIRNILIIVNKGQLDQFKKILPNGNNLGIKINYSEQQYPRGLPDAFLIGEKFIGKSNIALILGDNFFYGQSLTEKLKDSVKLKQGAEVFLHPISDPSAYGVAKVNKKNRIIKAANFDDFSTKYPEIRKMIGTWFENYDLNDEVQILRWTGEEAAKKEISKWQSLP